MTKFGGLIDQFIHIVPSFSLECGRELRDVPVAYKTWGNLNERKDNAMIICHAFTGSADVEDWWGPLMGRGKAFDSNRFFIFCANVLGSPYGSASPVTENPDNGRPYGPEFPPTTIRDDVRYGDLFASDLNVFNHFGDSIHRIVLDQLGVSSVAVAIGGSMGGMAVLEWPLCNPGYVRHVIPIATSARHSAWCISWGEAQRQSIYSDPGYNDGYYVAQPVSGLAAARMSALLTYRSRNSFESRFGRKPQAPASNDVLTPPRSPKSHADEARTMHNDGHKNAKAQSHQPTSASAEQTGPSVFSAQSYLRYQGDKFTARFDANCYIHITRKMDTHDVARKRNVVPSVTGDESLALAQTLSTLPSRALVISIETDGLFTTTEQRELAQHIPDATLVVVPSPDGHDGFLLEFKQINQHILTFLKKEFPEFYEADGDERPPESFEVQKTSIFGEAEVSITSW